MKIGWQVAVQSLRHANPVQLGGLRGIVYRIQWDNSRNMFRVCLKNTVDDQVFEVDCDPPKTK